MTDEVKEIAASGDESADTKVIGAVSCARDRRAFAELEMREVG